MALVSNSAETVVRGVSQQPLTERMSGQHTEQVNMISDPVYGLARRPGSIWQAEEYLPPNDAWTGLPASATHADNLNDIIGHKVFKFTSGGQEYHLLYRTQQNQPVSRNDLAFKCFVTTPSGNAMI
jgi:hypothetical protein